MEPRMTLTRRHFLATAGAAAALPQRLWARTTLDLGGTTVETLSDGHLVLPARFLLADRPVEDATDILARHDVGPDQYQAPCNLTLYRDGTNTVLFDAGSGADFMASAGRLTEALDAIGLDPSEVTHVVFTHAHPDHIWGVLDDFGDPLFSEATHLIGQAEFDYWTDPGTVDSIGEARAAFAVGAQRRIEAISDRLETFADDSEILPGIAAFATPGHTPGHMSFELRKSGISALVVGDAIVNHHIAFERPGWHAGSDQDPELAASTRTALLDRLAGEQMPLIGFHLPQGGFGRAERQGDAFRFVPGEV